MNALQAETADHPKSAQDSLALDETLVQTVMEHLGISRSEDCSWEMIAQGGSGREFYRVRSSGAGPRSSAIIMRYSDDREENLFYPEIASFLLGIQVNVPRVLFHDATRHLIGLEDLGDQSLFHAFQNASDEVRVEALYRSSLDQIQILHQHSACPARTMSGFDEKLYRWERSYFLENLVARWAKVNLSPTELRSIEFEGENMAAELVRAPGCLIHRDFQSQNLLVHENRVWLIDFQGMRLGHAAYDLASLLYDPYVKLDASRRVSLLDWYLDLSRSKRDRSVANGAFPKTIEPFDRNAFVRQFYCAAVQRLMQALGAYAFLGLVKEKRGFLRFIPQGLQNLADALNCLRDTPHTIALVQRILNGPRLKVGAV